MTYREIFSSITSPKKTLFYFKGDFSLRLRFISAKIKLGIKVRERNARVGVVVFFILWFLHTCIFAIAFTVYARAAHRIHIMQGLNFRTPKRGFPSLMQEKHSNSTFTALFTVNCWVRSRQFIVMERTLNLMFFFSLCCLLR